MKIIQTLLTLFVFQISFSQTTINSKTKGDLEFKELEYGLAKVKGGTIEKLISSPTGTYVWLDDFEIVDKSL